MFWLSYECFSILCNALLLKSAISSRNSCGPTTEYSCSCRRTEFRNIFPCSISQMIMKTGPISTRIAMTCAMKKTIPIWAWRKSVETETSIWQKFPDGGIATAEEIPGLGKGKLILFYGHSEELFRVCQSAN